MFICFKCFLLSFVNISLFNVTDSGLITIKGLASHSGLRVYDSRQANQKTKLYTDKDLGRKQLMFFSAGSFSKTRVADGSLCVQIEKVCDMKPMQRGKQLTDLKR